MKKREFLKNGAILTIGALTVPGLLQGCNKKTATLISEKDIKIAPPTPTPNIYQLPALEYVFNALEPHIDALTMEIHHGKHHAAYVNNLNKALEGHEWAARDLNDIFLNLMPDDKNAAIRNNGGGHYNHSLFWRTLGPNAGGSPQGKLLESINKSFGSFEAFKNQFVEAAMKVFGSGWAWLSVDGLGNLFISSTPNQDNPLMRNLVKNFGTPIFGLDVWEHAYYLKYQNRRKDYLMAIFNVVRWDRVAEELDKANR